MNYREVMSVMLKLAKKNIYNMFVLFARVFGVVMLDLFRHRWLKIYNNKGYPQRRAFKLNNDKHRQRS